jgi:hypothetical protein
MSYSDSEGPVEHLSRNYQHDQCKGVTTVSGDHLVMLECPFRPCSGTYCAVCRKMVPLKTVWWEDSGENIEEYRNKLY